MINKFVLRRGKMQINISIKRMYLVHMQFIKILHSFPSASFRFFIRLYVTHEFGIFLHLPPLHILILSRTNARANNFLPRTIFHFSFLQKHRRVPPRNFSPQLLPFMPRRRNDADLWYVRCGCGHDTATATTSYWGGYGLTGSMIRREAMRRAVR